MPATPARIGFITQDVRRAISGPSSTVIAKYGDLARDTTDPVETFFDTLADAQAMADERLALLSPDRRRLRFDVAGVDTGIGLTFSTMTPTAQAIDDERSLNAAAAVVEIGIDFDKAITSLTTWG